MSRLAFSYTIPIRLTLGQARPSLERLRNFLPQALFLTAGVVVLASYAVLALAHIRDRYQINFVSGVYTGLAMHLNSGTFYPEFYDGTHYGGTRYMPLQFVLQAGLARLTGEYLFSGKLLTFLLAISLFGLLITIARRQKCEMGVAVGLASLFVLTDPTLIALTTIRGDLLPVVLQLTALLLVAETLTPRRLVLAALFCALAFLAKLTAVWAALAIAWWTFRRQRRWTWLFVSVWLGWSIGAVLLLDSFAEGRMLANLFGLSGSGVGSLVSLLGPFLFLWRIAQSGPLLTLLLPLVVVESVLAWRQQRPTLYHLALGVCLLTTLGVYFDKEVGHNHLIDLIALSIPVLACLWGRVSEDVPMVLTPRPALALLLLWGTYMAWTGTLVKPVFEVIQNYRHGAAATSHPARPLASLIGEDDPVLAEDAWVAISRNRLPLVLDPYSLGRLSQSRPEIVEPLVERIREQQFRWIVLCQSLDDPNLLDRFRWEDRHFGPQVVQAMRDSYQLHSTHKGHFVYQAR